jgi:spatacsin
VELIILAHFYYEVSACLDGGDVLVSLAATRVDSYVAEGDFTSLARLVTGLSNFQRLRFILDLLIENGQLGLLLQKRDGAMVSSLPAIGFRMAVLSALKRFNSYDLDSFSQVCSQLAIPSSYEIETENEDNLLDCKFMARIIY